MGRATSESLDWEPPQERKKKSNVQVAEEECSRWVCRSALRRPELGEGGQIWKQRKGERDDARRGGRFRVVLVQIVISYY